MLISTFPSPCSVRWKVDEPVKMRWHFERSRLTWTLKPETPPNMAASTRHALRSSVFAKPLAFPFQATLWPADPVFTATGVQSDPCHEMNGPSTPRHSNELLNNTDSNS